MRATSCASIPRSPPRSRRKYARSTACAATRRPQGTGLVRQKEGGRRTSSGRGGAERNDHVELLESILREGVTRQASDIHLKIGSYPIFRVSGTLMPWDEGPRLDRDTLVLISQGL